MRLLLFCTLLLPAQAAEPVVSSWILSPPASRLSASAALRQVLPDVHEVLLNDDFVEVRSAGLSLLYLGPFQNPPAGEGGVRDLRFRLPRRPVAAEADTQPTGPGAMGVFLNGVPLYNRFADASYLGRNIWHFDTVAFKDPAHPLTLGLLEGMIGPSSEHSPLLGFALDGFPIYGPWGFAQGGVKRMRSGYRLRNIRERTRWPDGKLLTPSQYGPPVSAAFPLGTFAEDYEYRPDAGDLDASNGRFAPTPEYPNGTYAYYLTTSDTNTLAFPYFVYGRFRGRLPGVPEKLSHFSHPPLVAGKPTTLRFGFTGAHALEIVHEQPLHLMVVSADREVFNHIHPQWVLGDAYEVTHTFPRPGKYRLFAQYTLPGEAERVDTFDVEVTGPAVNEAHRPPPLRAALTAPKRVRTGQDINFTVELTGATVEPYLGAWGHFLFLDENLNNFIHAHPAESARAELDPMKPHIHGVSDLASGPPPARVSITTNFSEPGHYKLWAQFQVAGEPVVIPFVVEVQGPSTVSREKPTAPAGAVAVLVDARGFTPARIEVNGPVTLAVTRAITPNCGSQIVFPSLGIKRDLAVGETTLIDLPKVSGEIAFACGMGMLRGVVVGVVRN